LTDTKQLVRWWGEDGRVKAKRWEIDPRVGGPWCFEAWDATGKTVINGISDFRASGEIVEYDPPRLLAYTWVANWTSSQVWLHRFVGNWSRLAIKPV